MPAREAVVLRHLLERRGRDRARPLVSFEDGSRWTGGDALDEAGRAACALRSHGVGQGDRIALLLPNGADFLRAWWGASCAGATLVPLNTAWKGTMLRHALQLAAPVVTIADAAGAARVRDADPAQRVLAPQALLDGPAEMPPLDRPIEPWDLHHLQFTSGTTGPSKASRNTHLQFFLNGSWATVDAGLTADDIFLIDLPLFHQAAMSMVATSLATGTALAVRGMPSLRRYWDVAAETGATCCFLLGTMAALLLETAPVPAERQHRVRQMITAPYPAEPVEFCRRFGVAELITAYGSSEVSGPLVRLPADPLVPGSCGRPRPGYEVRLVDAHDVEVPVGAIGELVVRTDLPWALTQGYEQDAQATADAYRNGWFHTGDLFSRDEHDTYFFRDRAKDAVRRRGENISSFEVEREVAEHPDVREVACVGASLGAETDGEEVMVFLVLHDGRRLDVPEMARWLVERMPHYMVPRFYEVVGELPVTETMKVRKNVLRERGVGPATIDLGDLGLRVTRDELVTT